MNDMRKLINIMEGKMMEEDEKQHMVFDGHDYTIIHDANPMTSGETVEVYDSANELVGEAFVDHNMEDGHIVAADGESFSLNYYEAMNGDNLDVEKVAQMVVVNTSPY